MGILDRLRKAEKQGVEAARHSMERGIERARLNWEEAESRMRRKMRVHPGNPQRSQASSDNTATPGSMAEPQSSVAEQPTPIISVHGKDLPSSSLKSPAA